VLAALAAFQVWWFQRETPTEQQLTAVARSIAKSGVEVRCPSIWRRLVEVSSFAGEAHFDGEGKPTHANLQHGVCKTFERLREDGFPENMSCLTGGLMSCPDEERDAAFAVHVLSHESWHLAGVIDEGITECYAFQTDAEVARRFGADDGQAELIAAAMLGAGASAVLPQYRPSSDCRSGGRYDLHPGTAAWPSR
jgi:hypothetical protein